jgi:ABC-type Fe3+-hydroxamate transport system substrate-binding protein
MPTWAAFLFLGLLVWIEGKTIKTRIKNEVDEAIEEYETLQADAPTVSVPPPVYSETGSDFFDEMRLTAPWVDREEPSDRS